MSEIFAAFWFFLPAGLANAAPVLAAKVPFLKSYAQPIDMGKSWRGRRIFGANKTWRGLFAGAFLATLVIALQKLSSIHVGWLRDMSWVDYSQPETWWLGPLFGVGVLVADAIESFFKRQRGTPPGDSWFPFDQIDYIIGGCLFSWLIIQLPFASYVWVLITWFGMHLLSVYVSYRFGIRDKPI